MMRTDAIDFVPETRIGFWFLGTETWTQHVIRVALRDLQPLIPERRASYAVVLDAGCGQGKSFRPLIEHFAPERLIGIDVHARSLARAKEEAAKARVLTELYQRDICALGLPNECVDIVFCHQTLHHVRRQELALREFHRVLRPGGLLLFAESTRAYIQSWVIRMLFRHPMEVQRSAEEYMAMIRSAGFDFGTTNVSLPYLWWSRPDLGAREWFGFGIPAVREETLVNLVAVRRP